MPPLPLVLQYIFFKNKNIILLQCYSKYPVQKICHRYNSFILSVVLNPVLSIVPIMPFITFPSSIQNKIKDHVLNFICHVLLISLNLKQFLCLSVDFTYYIKYSSASICPMFPCDQIWLHMLRQTSDMKLYLQSIISGVT